MLRDEGLVDPPAGERHAKREATNDISYAAGAFHFY
jgi:hypothetical protein